jgi:hypothetical protein
MRAPGTDHSDTALDKHPADAGIHVGPHLVSVRYLACVGSLFSASLHPGWQTQALASGLPSGTILRYWYRSTVVTDYSILRERLASPIVNGVYHSVSDAITGSMAYLARSHQLVHSSNYFSRHRIRG